ncbi:MAG: pyridoxal 5'-phosphate synthase glutaminase subunit PdxT [Acidobacteria bacterium]|nr:pyridoxal 5'-phosphate synthase glutaminase subunit PdxT [Acidobacteriota bacterium]
MAVIGILAVQGDFDAHSKAVGAVGERWKLVKKPSDLDGVSGLILPGGESTTFLKHLEEEGLAEPIRQFARTKPVFGTCAGAILLAETVENPAQPSLGLMQITVRRNAYGRQLSSSIRTLTAEPELSEIGPEAGTPMEAVLIRAPVITAAGAQVRTLARLQGDPALVRQGFLLAGTFHPELTTDTRVHRYFCQIAAQVGKSSSVSPAEHK